MGTVAFLSFSALHLTINMKFLVLAACVAVSSAQGFFGLQSHPNGAVTPVDEPAVAAARADHLATKFGAGLGYAAYAPGYAAGYGYAGYGGLGYAGYGYGAGLGYAGYAGGYAAGYGYSGLGYAGYAPAYAAGYGYAGPLNLNTQLIAHPNGAVVPLDEPAVAAARAAHLDTQAAEYAASAPIVSAPIVSSAPVAAAALAVAATPVADNDFTYAGPLNLNTKLVGYPNGAVVPVDEPAVAAARADHLATQAAEYSVTAPIVAAVSGVADSYSYTGPLNLNTELVNYPNGAVVPADEPAVAAARADHLASKGAAYAAAAPIVAAVPAVDAGYSYSGPLNLNTELVDYPNGAVVPVDEPAVVAARADHLAAHKY